MALVVEASGADVGVSSPLPEAVRRRWEERGATLGGRRRQRSQRSGGEDEEEERRLRQQAAASLADLNDRLEAASRKREELCSEKVQRAAAAVTRAMRVAKARRDLEAKEVARKKAALEAQVRAARLRRQEQLDQRGSPTRSTREATLRRQLLIAHARRLQKLWRQFCEERHTTASLMENFKNTRLSISFARSAAFEDVASVIQSPSTLASAETLLSRLEEKLVAAGNADPQRAKMAEALLSRITPSRPRVVSRTRTGASAATRAAASGSGSTSKPASAAPKAVEGSKQAGASGAKNEKRARTPSASSAAKGRSAAQQQEASGNATPNRPRKRSRFSPRVFLSAFMIVGQPHAVMSQRETSEEKRLLHAAERLLTTFEALLAQHLEGGGAGEGAGAVATNTADSTSLPFPTSDPVNPGPIGGIEAAAARAAGHAAAAARIYTRVRANAAEAVECAREARNYAQEALQALAAAKAGKEKAAKAAAWLAAASAAAGNAAPQAESPKEEGSSEPMETDCDGVLQSRTLRASETDSLNNSLAGKKRQLGGGGEAEVVPASLSKQQQQRKKLSSLLVEFDIAWVEFLDQFVVWKTHDAAGLEKELINMACQLESSLLERCGADALLKETQAAVAAAAAVAQANGEENLAGGLPAGKAAGRNQDLDAIREQVPRDQAMIRERLGKLTGPEGVERLDKALATTREAFAANAAAVAAAAAEAALAEAAVEETAANLIAGAELRDNALEERESQAVDDLSGAEKNHEPIEALLLPTGVRKGNRGGKGGPSNEQLLLEMLYSKAELAVAGGMNDIAPAITDSAALRQVEGAASRSFGRYNPTNRPTQDLQRKFRAATEAAFWDGVSESVSPAGGKSSKAPGREVVGQSASEVMMAEGERVREDPARRYRRLAALVGELAGEFTSILTAPKLEGLREEIRESLNPARVTESLLAGDFGLDDLKSMLDYGFNLLLKFGMPARDEELRAAYTQLLADLQQQAASPDSKESSLPALMVPALRFLFERVRQLKEDITWAKIRLRASTLDVPAGMDYLRRCLRQKHAIKSVEAGELQAQLPATAEWLAAAISSLSKPGAREGIVGGNPDAIFQNDNRMEEVQQQQQHGSQNGSKAGSVIPVSMTSGRWTASLYAQYVAAAKRMPISSFSSTLSSAASTADAADPALVGALNAAKSWEAAEVVVSIGIVERLLWQKSGPLASFPLPETLLLDSNRLRRLQDDFQRATVSAVSLLLLRQTLSSQVPLPSASTAAEIEAILKRAKPSVWALTGRSKPSLSDIAAALVAACTESDDDEAGQGKESLTDAGASNSSSPIRFAQAAADPSFLALLEGLLQRTVKRGQPVFEAVASGILSALKTMVLLGLPAGNDKASTALLRAGAGWVQAEVVEIAVDLHTLVAMNTAIYLPFYAPLIEAARSGKSAGSSIPSRAAAVDAHSSASAKGCIATGSGQAATKQEAGRREKAESSSKHSEEMPPDEL